MLPETQTTSVNLRQSLHLCHLKQQLYQYIYDNDYTYVTWTTNYISKSTTIATPMSPEAQITSVNLQQ